MKLALKLGGDGESPRQRVHACMLASTKTGVLGCTMAPMLVINIDPEHPFVFKWTVWNVVQEGEVLHILGGWYCNHVLCRTSFVQHFL